MVFEADGGILQFLKSLLVKARLSLLRSILLDVVQTHTHSEIRYLGCGSGNVTRATWKTERLAAPFTYY